MFRSRTLALALMVGFALTGCEKKAPVNDAGMSPDMVRAIVQGKDAEVSRLLDAGEAVDALQNGQTALCIAAMNNKLSIMGVLIAKGANVNHATQIDGTTPLMYAAKSGSIDAVKTLLAQGAKIDAQDKVGATALHYAVMGGSIAVAEELLTREPKLAGMSTNPGISPVILAINMMVQPNASKNDSDMAKYLKKLYGIGADTLKPTVQ
ncbi:MAG: ankyrin repeat domain-containing protein [Fibrobacteria bacterium]|nr:ankyrin repeat domain-containing protein [Fibrobacteria bacterium]